jgi:hypothetical protein
LTLQHVGEGRRQRLLLLLLLELLQLLQLLLLPGWQLLWGQLRIVRPQQLLLLLLQ